MRVACMRSLDEQPGEVASVERLLALYREAGDLESVETLLEEQIRATNVPSERGRLSYWLGQHYQERGYLDKALTSFEGSWRLDSNAFETAHALAGAYRDRKQWRKLAGVLSRKIELFETEGESLPVLLELGHLSRDQLDDISEASNAFERALEVDSNNISALDGLLDICLAQKRFRRFVELSQQRAALESDTDAKYPADGCSTGCKGAGRPSRPG